MDDRLARTFPSAAAGASAAALCMLLRMDPWVAVSAALTASSAFVQGQDGRLSAVMTVLAAITLLSGRLDCGASLLLAGCAGAILSAGLLPRALAAFGAIAAASASGGAPLAGICAACAIPCVLDRFEARAAVSCVLLVLAGLLAGIPGPSPEREILLQESFTETGGATWDRATLDLSMTTALLRMPGGGVLELALDGGGVEGDMPIGFVQHAGGLLTLGTGRRTVVLDVAGEMVEIRIARDFRSFEHTVIHLEGARFEARE